jgi:hypothetical protein
VSQPRQAFGRVVCSTYYVADPPSASGTCAGHFQFCGPQPGPVRVHLPADMEATLLVAGRALVVFTTDERSILHSRSAAQTGQGASSRQHKSDLWDLPLFLVVAEALHCHVAHHVRSGMAMPSVGGRVRSWVAGTFVKKDEEADGRTMFSTCFHVSVKIQTIIKVQPTLQYT